MTTFIIIAVIVVLVVLAVAAFMMRQKKRETHITQADEMRSEAATKAQSTLPPAQDRAAEAEARADEAKARAERAEAEAEHARVAAAQAEAEHEGRVRAADEIDPRVKHTRKDYAPQVGGTTDQQPTGPSEVDSEVDSEVGHDHDVAASDTTAADTTANDATAGDADARDTTYDESPSATDASVGSETDSETTSDTTSDTATAQRPTDGTAPSLPRRTPGANDMPGKPMEAEGGTGGWFTRKDSDQS